MGCDRNLFTLRLVLNQTQGEWQWQAAAVEWGGGWGDGVEKALGSAMSQGSGITVPL